MKFYTDWIAGEALPFWSSRGFDAAAGRFRERLDASGAALEVPHRAMVQARQIYVFAHAELLGWAPTGALAERAMASLRRDFIAESRHEASAAFSVDPTGGIVSEVRDAYAHAFILFALAWLYRLNGDRDLLSLADRITAFVDARLLDRDHGGLFDAWPVTDPGKRQNPLMHMLEAYLALERAAPGRGFAERARAIVALFRERLFDARHGVILEHFARDWSVHPDPAKARVFEPGHHLEWVWLLRDHAELTGDDLGPLPHRLFETAVMHGISPEGLIFDELSDDLRVIKPSHRLWPHTEGIKAATARARGGHDANALTFATAMANVLLDRFLGRPFAGGWIDQLDPHGQALVDYVPASSLYHLFFAAAEADRAFTAHPAAAGETPRHRRAAP